MLCPTCPGPGEGGRRVKCAQCGTDTGSAARVCVVCGALAPRRPSLVAGGPGASPAGAPSGSARFSTTRLRPGYDREDVDAFIEAVRDTFLGVRQPPLTADEIRTKMFMTTRLRPGYDEEEVDAFLGEAEARLRTACVGCGAEMGTARTCRRCGAPVHEHSQDQAPVPAPALVEAAESPDVLRVLAWIGVALLNLLALYYVIGSVVTGTEGSPAWGANYLPPWVCAVIGFTGAIVPACTVVIVVRRSRERRAIACDSPELLPESLD